MKHMVWKAAAVLASLGILLGWWWNHNDGPKMKVTFYQGMKPLECLTTGKTVEDAVRQQGIRLKPQDVTVPPLTAAVTQGMEIDLGLVERHTATVKKRVPCDTQR